MAEVTEETTYVYYKNVSSGILALSLQDGDKWVHSNGFVRLTEQEVRRPLVTKNINYNPPALKKATKGEYDSYMEKAKGVKKTVKKVAAPPKVTKKDGASQS